MNLYNRIGEDKIAAVIADFYEQAFGDPIIGHFFFKRDKLGLIKKQTDFAVGLFGGPKRYEGSPLREAHSEFAIRPAHFDRRQVLLKNTMISKGLARHEIEEWLAIEENMRKLVVTVVDACNSTVKNAQA